MKRLLAVLAHPDDESFGPGGTLALYAREGVEVHLICATRGDVGAIPPDMQLNAEETAHMRLDELRCAAEQLGLTDVHILGYRDSGMPGSSDNNHPEALAAAPVAEVAEKIAGLMRQIRPQVVITHDPVGGYHHPDHIAVHKAAVAAFNSVRGELEGASAPRKSCPQKLYYHTFPRRFLRIMVRLLPLFGKNPRKFGRNEDIDLLEISRDDFPIHARIDFRRVAEIKEKASACHQSQQGLSSGGLFGVLMRLFSGPETFTRAYPTAEDKLRERDLFDGVDSG
ncbi:MAG: PIG-L family deacetylase [Chloroflexota bacterium]|nr:PIG-L family deacetylase [Chloroflexota bacterium]